MPIESITRREVLLEAIRMAGAQEATGTADAGGSAVLDDSILTHPNTDQLRGCNIYILDGAAQGDDRIISAFTPASDRVTVVPNWSATTDTSTVYVILKKPWRINTFIDGINHAIRVGRENGVVIPKVNYELIGQDILFGIGNMSRWSSGATSAPDGWTMDGNSSVARREENPKLYLPYQARLTSDGSNLGYLQKSITNFSAFRDQVIDVRGFIRTNTASRVTISINDGVTSTSSTVISAAADLNEWRDTEETDGPAIADHTVASNPTELTIALNISAGSAVQADFAGVRAILKSRAMHEFDIPQGAENTRFKFIHAIELGRKGRDDFIPSEVLQNRHRISPSFRIVDREPTRRLWIERSSGGTVGPTYSSIRYQRNPDPVPADVPIRILGSESLPILSSDDTTVSANATFLATYAAWYAATTTPLGISDTEGLAGKIAMWERRWQEILRDMDVRPKAGSIRVWDF